MNKKEVIIQRFKDNNNIFIITDQNRKFLQQDNNTYSLVIEEIPNLKVEKFLEGIVRA